MSSTTPSPDPKGPLVRRLLRKTKNAFKPRSKKSSLSARSSTIRSRSPSPVAQFETTPSRTSVSSLLAPGTNPKTNKNGRGRSWTALEKALRSLEKTSRGFPMLQSAVGTMISSLDTFHAAGENRQDYEELALELEGHITLLATHLAEGGLKVLSDSVLSMIQLINTEAEFINNRRQQETVRKLAESNEDAEDLFRCYRRIGSLFNRLQIDATLSIWSITNEQLANTRLEAMCPAKLASYNSVLSVAINRRTCTENTRLAVLSELNDWSTDPAAAKFYWMNGMAGTGKTTIACTKCENLEKHKLLGASFFCTRTSPECRSVKRIVPTIAYQLARYSRPFQAALCQVLEDDPDIATRKFSLQFEYLLKTPLLEVEEAIPENVVVVIDALDECDDSEEVRMFLTELFRVAKDLPLKFFVTSRPEPEIRDQMLSHSDSARSVLHLHEIERSLVQADIELYLKEELAAISPSAEEIKRLAELSGSLFIYAATAVRYIRSKKKSTNPAQRLQTVLSAQSGSSKRYAEIDGLYIAILEAALDEEGIEDTGVQNVQLVLWTAICVREPVMVETLSALVGITEEEVESVLQSLRSVLYISEDSGLVSTLHASFPDFIFSQERSRRFFCDEKIHGQVIARQCFEIMKSRLRSNICNLESSFLLDEQVEGLDERVRTFIPRPLSYACRYCFDHLVSAAPSGELLLQLETFLSNQLLFWVEVLNLVKSIDLGVIGLQMVRLWFPKISSTPDLLNLASDAQQFVFDFSKDPISRSTPHIYISALPFCNKSSSIFARYRSRMRGLMQVEGTALTKNTNSAFATWATGTSIKCIAVSPDGNMIAFGGPNGKIGIISRTNGSFLALPFRGHTNSIRSIAFSPDGARIATASADETIRVWKVQDGVCVLGPFEGHSGKVLAVAFSPDGTLIASGSSDRTVRLWNAHNGTSVASFQGHSSRVNSVAFSPDGTCIASASDDETIRVWRTRDGTLTTDPFEGHGSYVRSIAFSPDGSRIVSGSSDSIVCVRNVQDGTLALPPFEGHTSSLRSVAFSPDGTLVASGARDHTVLLWNAQNGTLFADPFVGHTSKVKSVAFSPDSSEVISGSHDETIRVWRVQANANAALLPKAQTNHITSVTFSPDGARIISSSRGNTSIWSAQDGMHLNDLLKGHSSKFNSVSVSPNGELIVSGSDDQTLCVWNAQDGTLIAPPFKGHTGPVFSVAFSPDSMRVASGSDDMSIRVWKAQDGTPLVNPFEGHSNSVLSVAFSPDGTQIVSGSADWTICVWNAQDGTLIGNPFKGHTYWIRSVAFSPDGWRVVSGSDDRTICIWNVADGTLVTHPFEGHTGRVRSVAFSPDGLQIISGSDDCTICLWNAEDGTLISPPFQGHTGNVFSVAFSPDGARIVSGSTDGTIRLTSPQSIPNTNLPLRGDWHVDDSGWAINADGHHLFFIPPELRPILPGAHQPLVISPRGTIQICYNDPDVVMGDWSHCFIR
ncbi:Vegetative incompatibility protein HET-E-1 [Ceratobasidium theobromae]|uniref:Vegetative incompatibility protein HET-E-1 n=1 Tax=Ceratobasidium theobromae TaxID=1582974 RepID=A0A5N5QF18_9AGAM|nr:Vegetative incompatibility protein HET-E-1 [Ceratobasidium theobromae]